MEYIGPNYALLIGGPILLIGLLIWFIKSKTRLKRLTVIFTSLVILFLGLAIDRTDTLDKEKNEVLYEIGKQNIESSTELMSKLNFDTTLIAYYCLATILVILIVVIELKNKNLAQQG